MHERRKIKRHAALVVAGHVIGDTVTAAANGAVVSYGVMLDGGGMYEYGWAKVSRARKRLRQAHELCSQEWHKVTTFSVNDGGGDPY